MTPEFSRPERVDTIGAGARPVAITADEQERAALARRFGLLSVDRLEARFSVRRDASSIIAEGEVDADVVQACSVTGDPVPATVREAVALRFVEPAAGEDEVELSADALDTMEIEGGAIDLGEAAAETVALALDPFPRSARAAEVLRAAGVISEDDVVPSGPLSGLAALLKK